MVLSLVQHKPAVDPIDEAILTALQDGKPGVFTQLLDRTRISHNTLRLHLERLAKQGLITKEKTRAMGLGRPKLPYVIPQRVRRQARAIRPVYRNRVSTVQSPQTPLQIRERRILQTTQKGM